MYMFFVSYELVGFLGVCAIKFHIGTILKSIEEIPCITEVISSLETCM